MLQKIKYLSILLMSFFVVQIGSAQTDSYILLKDPSGLGPSASEEAELEEAADSLIAAFPMLYQDSFKVFEGAIYPLMGYINEGSEESWMNLKTQAENISKNYLIIVRDYQIDGTCILKTELKLPHSWLLTCYDVTYINRIENSIKSFYSSSKSTYTISELNNTKKRGIELLRVKIEKLRTCCFINGMRNEECSDCTNAYDIMNDIEILDLEAFYFGNVTNSDPNTNQNCLCDNIVGFNKVISRGSNDIIDLAELDIEIENVIYKFDEEISNHLNNNSFIGIITKNESFCSQLVIDNLKAEFSSSDNGIWIHTWENPVSSEKDIIFIKYKLKNSEEAETEANFNILNEEAIFPQPFQYKITHRSFAPWDRFGHLPLVHTSKNSFHGDNRGFSLKKSVLSDGITARITQSMMVKLGIGKQDYSLFSSITKGYRNFKQTVETNYITNPYKEGGRYIYGPAKEETDFSKPKGYGNTLVNNKITYAGMFFEGSDPLVIIAPDIEWYLELAMFTSSDNYLHIKKTVIGKSFPAYEAFIEDKCGKSLFLHSVESDCESNLVSNLMKPFPTYNYNGLIKIKINSVGCFLNDIINVEGNITSILTIGDYNNIILNKNPAKDCTSIPCQGAYENNGNDKSSFYNCGN